MLQKIAITLDKKTMAKLDRWVQEGKFPNRSRVGRSAVDLPAGRQKCGRLARELAKLDRNAEQRMADEGFGGGSRRAFGEKSARVRGSEFAY